MDFPKRAPTHVAESKSWKILQAKTPSHWILREVTERDYGIDCYIELVTNAHEVTGNLLMAQLKGTEDIGWKGAKTTGERKAVFSGIERSTINYWMNLPVPVFLFVADLAEGQLFFAPVKEQVRSKYSDFRNQQSLGFDLRENLELGTTAGDGALVLFYFREKCHEKLISDIRMLLVHWQKYAEFIRDNQGLDCFLGVEIDDELLMLHVFQTCQFVSQFVGVDWGIPPLSDFYEQDRKIWKDEYYRLHNKTLTAIFEKLEPQFFEILGRLQKLITEKQKDFWEAEQFLIYHMCQDLDRQLKEYRRWG